MVSYNLEWLLFPDVLLWETWRTATTIIDPFGNKQEDYIYNLAAEEIFEKERKEKGQKAT